MVARGTRLPKKLRQDAIVEALWEIQFDTTTLPERLIGRLSDTAPWKDFQQRRLPSYDLPAALRQTDPNLRYLATVEVSNASDNEYRALRIGPNVLSVHRSRRYVGWLQFRGELEEAAEGLFKAAESLTATRLGLRYLNALHPQRHGIASLADLDLSIEVAGERLTHSVNVNFQVGLGNVGYCRVGIATPEYVQGALPEGSSVYVDVDVYTPPGYQGVNVTDVKRWLDNAHTHAKIEFFHLLRQGTIDQLWED